MLSREKEEDKDFDVVSNPEFLREGKGLYDFFHPSRIVVGSKSDRALAVIRELYEPFISNANSEDFSFESSGGDKWVLEDEIPLVETDIKSAQMIKYASNAFLATRISFIHEIAGLCENVGADVKEVSNGTGYDERIGHGYLDAGIGFGGPCLEKDIKALIKIAENNDYEPQFVDAVYDKNGDQIKRIVGKVKKLARYPLYKKRVTVLGLAFKPGINAVRTSL